MLKNNMCGGIGFKLSKINKSQLKEFLDDEEIHQAEKSGEVRVYYWSKKPFLPVFSNNTTQLLEWGNRDKKSGSPATGWAKEESINNGKWDRYKPEVVKIIAESGYEKGKWFKINGSGIKGIIIKNDHKNSVYMVTKSSSEEYIKKVGHDREPVILE